MQFLTDAGEIRVRKLPERLTKADINHEVVLLLEEMLGESPVCIGHTAAGKPYLENMESLQLSISHAAGWIAVYVSDKTSVGIDIEPEHQKIRKASSHFINAAEKQSFGIFSLAQLHLIWGAKEAVYKCFGGRFEALEKEVTVMRIDTGSILAETIYGQVECFYKVLEGNVYLVYIRHKTL